MTEIHAGNGRVRGYINETLSRKTISDKSNKTLGWYDKAQDKTFSRQGQYIGPGDQSMSLLED
jgi:hypothetical protein